MTGNKGKVRISLLLIAVMVVMLAGCAKGGNTGNTAETAEAKASEAPATTEAPRELIRLTFDVRGDNPDIETEGLQSDAVIKEIEKRLNIEIEFKKLSDEQFKVLAASGDLPDIVLTDTSKDRLPSLIDGNNLVDLETLMAYAPDVQKQESRLQYSKKYLSQDTGKLYALPTGAGPISPQYTYDIGVNLRWDYYRELGFPPINSQDDLLNVIKQMQEKHPETEDGKRTYGFSLWTDSGTWPYKLLHSYGNGYEQAGTLEYNTSTYAFTSYLMDEHSTWWQGLQFFNKANRMGLLDPESFTQKLENAMAKSANGQVLTTFVREMSPLNAELSKQGQTTSGYMPIPGAFPEVFRGGYSSNGYNRLLAITKNCKYPERAMELLNFLFSEDGARLIFSGLKGERWTDEGGKPRLTDEMLQSFTTLAAGELKKQYGIGKYAQISGYSEATVHSDGGKMNLALAPEVFTQRLNPIDKDYSEHYGVSYPGEVFEQLAAEGKLKFVDINTDFQLAMGAQPDDFKRIDASLADFVSNSSAKAILAKTDEEFEAVKKDLIAEMVKMGLDKSNQYWTDVFNRITPEFQGK